MAKAAAVVAAAGFLASAWNASGAVKPNGAPPAKQAKPAVVPKKPANVPKKPAATPKKPAATPKKPAAAPKKPPAAPKKPAAGSVSSEHRSPRNAKRPLRKSTRFIVLHTTEGAAKGALEKLSANGECHYVVDTDGCVYSIIDRGRVAYHAGLSMWNGATGLDSVSVGIEVVGWHDKDVTEQQIASLRKLLADLKAAYKVPDDRVLTHSMVAYGNPNHWHKKKHRGRKRCGMQFADPDLRRKLGLSSKPAFDPDIKAGRLFDADPELTAILYRKAAPGAKPAPHIVAAPPSGAARGGAAAKGTASAGGAVKPAPGKTGTAFPVVRPENVIGPRRSAWDIARDQYDSPTTVYRFPDGTVKKGSEISGREWRTMQAGTVVEIGDAGDSPSENSGQGLLEIGVDGSVWDLAGDDMVSSSTFYFPPGGGCFAGATATVDAIEALPAGTKLLVGYKSGGPVSAKRPVFSICGPSWNHPDTYYWDPVHARVVSGDDIDEKNIPKGARVFWR